MVLVIIKDILGFFQRYAPTGFALALLISLLYGVVCLLNQRIKKEAGAGQRNVERTAKRGSLIFLLSWYAYIVIGITMLSRSESPTRQVSFELFRTFRNTFFAKKQICENVIMFVPYAVLLYMLAKSLRRGWKMFGIGVMSSLLIEVMQWVTQTGCFEVDDILTNTMGMMIGYGICVVIDRLRNKNASD